MAHADLTAIELFDAAVSYSRRRGKLKAETDADPEKSRSTGQTFVLAAASGRVIDRIPLDKLYRDAEKMQDIHLPDISKELSTIGKSLPAIGKTAASLTRIVLFLGLLAVSLSVTVFFPPLGLFMLFILALVALTAK
jgi:hypothetical protein